MCSCLCSIRAVQNRTVAAKRQCLNQPYMRVGGQCKHAKSPKSKVQGPKSKVQSPRSKVQGPKSKVQSPRSKVQGCIKLRFARASVAVREIFASRSAGQPNPEGWQRVAGGRFGAAGETTTGHALRSGLHPGGMPEACVRKQSQPFSLYDQRQAGQSSGTDAGCRVR